MASGTINDKNINDAGLIFLNEETITLSGR